MTEIFGDNQNIAAAEYIKKTLIGVDSNLMCEAMQRVKDHAYKNEVIGGEVGWFLSARVLKAIEDIRREREAIKENNRKEQLRQHKELQEEFKPLDDKPPVDNSDGSLAQPVRVATREELQNMLYALDKNYKFLFEQINGLNDALDVMQSDMKMLKTKMQMFEDIITSIPVDSTNDKKDVNTNNKRTD